MKLHPSESENSKEILKERTCPMCGGIFITHGAMWGYKLQKKKQKVVYLCSWHCYQDAMKHQAKLRAGLMKKRKERMSEEEIREVLRDIARGMSIRATAISRGLKWDHVNKLTERYSDWLEEEKDRWTAEVLDEEIQKMREEERACGAG